MDRALRVAIDLRPVALDAVSGVALVTIGIVEALGERGVRFVGLSDRPIPAGRVPHQIPVAVESGAGGRIRWENLTLPRLLKRLDPAPHLFHATWNHGVPGGLPFPSVLTVHDLIPWRMPRAVPWPRPAFLHRALYRRAVGQSSRRAARIVAVSETTRREIEAVLPEVVARVSVVPNALPRWYRPMDPSHAAEARIRFSGGRPYWLYVGGFDPRKGLGLLVRAVAEAFPDRALAPELVLAGAMNETGRATEALASRLGVAARFPGYVPDSELPLLFAGASLFVYPSEYEGFGLPLLFGMASGVPCVAGDAGATPEVLGDAGITFRAGDAHALAATLRAASGSAASLGRLRERGPERVREFSAERQASRMMEEYERAASGPRGSA